MWWRRRRSDDADVRESIAETDVAETELDGADEEAGEDEPGPLITPRHLRWVAALSALTLLVSALSGSRQMADLAAGHGLPAKVAGYLAGGTDSVLTAVDDAHDAMNASIWLGRSSGRREACSDLERAVEAATEIGYTDAEISEIQVRLGTCRNPAAPAEVVHDQVVGLEVYLRLGQGR